MRISSLALLAILACSSPSKPPVVEPDQPPPVDAAVAVAEPDPDPEAVATVAKLDSGGAPDKSVTLAISILARQKHGLPTVLGVVERVPTAATAGIVAHAIGEAARRVATEPDDRAKVAASLLVVVKRPLEEYKAAQDRLGQQKLMVMVVGPALQALADLHVPEVVEPALLHMVRHPPLYASVKRALVAAGPTAREALVKVLRGEHVEIERVLKDEKLGVFCPNVYAVPNPATLPKGCQPLSVRDHHAADILGHFHDPSTVPELLAALKRPALPYYYTEDGKPGPVTQHFAIFEALRRIGDPAAAKPFELLWTNRRTPALTRLLAVASYPFVSSDASAVKKLAPLVTQAGVSADLKREAAIAVSRQSRDVADIKIIRKLASANSEYQLLYLAPIPRIAIVAKCKEDLSCYAAAERMTADELVGLVKPHMKEVEAFEPLDREELLVVAIDRAVFELRRAGQKAAPFTDTLLELAASNRRELRHFGSLALPRVAPVPCPKCVQQLDKAIAAAKLPDAAYDLTLVRDYFFWSGKTP